MSIAKLYDLKYLQNVYKKFKVKKPNYTSINEDIKVYMTEKLHKLDRSKLSKITRGKNRFIKNWNNFVSGKISERDLSSLIYDFSDDFSQRCFLSSSYNDQKSLTKSLQDSRFKMSSDHDHDTGNIINLFFDLKTNGFKVEVERFIPIRTDSGGYSGRFEKVEKDTFKNKIFEEIVEFKSGNLIINDYFRTSNNEFRDAIKEDTDFDLNCTKGRVDAISYYAKNFNFVSVNIGNSSPYIFKSKKGLMIGKSDKKSLGSVCTDLWNASIIDEENFVEILVKNGMTLAKAKKELAAQKKIWTCTSTKVKPGKYKVIFCGNYEEFNSKYRRKSKDNELTTKCKPYFILEKI